MPTTKARSGAFQKGADVRSNRRQGHATLHHFETAHSCECRGHYKKDIHTLLKSTRHRETSAEADRQCGDFNPSVNAQRIMNCFLKWSQSLVKDFLRVGHSSHTKISI